MSSLSMRAYKMRLENNGRKYISCLIREGTHRACPAIASPAMNGDSLVVLQRVVCDLEELGDLVWSRRLHFVHGDFFQLLLPPHFCYQNEKNVLIQRGVCLH